MKKNIFLLTISLPFFISCKKNITQPATSPININFVKAALDYVKVNPNKYFIYKDSATGNTDSVIVTESAVKTIAVPGVLTTARTIGYPAYSYDAFTLLLSKVNDDTSADWFYGTALASSFSFMGIISTNTAPLWLSEIDRATGMVKAYVFQYPYIHSDQAIAKLNIEGVDYTDVTFSTSNTTNTASPNYFSCAYYWVKGIGVIKRRITTTTGTQTWTLLRHG